MMRGRREERREERQDDRQLGRPGRGGNRYQMRQKMVAISDDFWIENEQGQKVFKVDGKALSVCPHYLKRCIPAFIGLPKKF